MAQKAAKSVARRNAQALNQLHLISITLHALFIIYRLIIHRRSATTSAYTRYIILSLPAVLIELYLEKIARPVYSANGDGLRRAGEDLDGKGLMEYMWDVIYVTWACLVLVALMGEWVWWLWAVIPLYATYTGASMFLGLRKSFGGLGGQAEGQDGDDDTSGQSNRQKKLEKRGGQKIRYR